MPAPEEVSIDMPPPLKFPCGYIYFDVDCTVNIGSRQILTTVTYYDSVAQQWIRDVNRIYRKHRGRLVVGLRLYRQCIYGRRGVEDSRFSVIVLCIGSRCLIYNFGNHRRHKIGKPLVDFLRDTKISFVGVDIWRDVERLRRDFPMLSVDSVYELRTEVERLVLKDNKKMMKGDLKASNLEELALVLLGLKLVDVPKPHDMVDSTDCRMRRAQILRACFEAFLVFEIGWYIYG